MRSRRSLRGALLACVASIAVLSSAAGLLACGGSGAESAPVAHVGKFAISNSQVDRWARALQRGAGAGLAAHAEGSPSQRALAGLIAADWLRGEAAARNLTPAASTVERALAERREANGTAEFEQSLHASGQNEADVKLEIEAELAAVALRREALGEVPEVTQKEVAAYFATHRKLFRAPEKRFVQLIEDLPSPAAAISLVGRIGTGAAFAKRAIPEELLTVPEGGPKKPRDIEDISDAIFAAPQGVLSKPWSLNHHWAIFIVRKIVPSRLMPLAAARATILKRLAAQHRALALERFANAYRRRWTEKTTCSPGYVVVGCADYTGPIPVERGPFSAG